MQEAKQISLWVISPKAQKHKKRNFLFVACEHFP